MGDFRLEQAFQIPERERETNPNVEVATPKARKLSAGIPFWLPALLNRRSSQMVFVNSESQMVEIWASKLRVNTVVSGEYPRRCRNGSEESEVLKV